MYYPWILIYHYKEKGSKKRFIYTFTQSFYHLRIILAYFYIYMLRKRFILAIGNFNYIATDTQLGNIYIFFMNFIKFYIIFTCLNFMKYYKIIKYFNSRYHKQVKICLYCMRLNIDYIIIVRIVQRPKCFLGEV